MYMHTTVVMKRHNYRVFVEPDLVYDLCEAPTDILYMRQVPILYTRLVPILYTRLFTIDMTYMSDPVRVYLIHGITQAININD